MAKEHGIFVYEEGTALTVPQEATAGLQVVVGTAPVNMAADPSSAVNTPVLANSAQEAMQELGYSKDFEKYTLCATMYATSNLYQVFPVVYINVLDPKRHRKPLEATKAVVSDMEAVVGQTGVLKGSLTVMAGETVTTYTAVTATEGSNPREEGWYTLRDGSDYVKAQETSVRSGAAYYALTADKMDCGEGESPKDKGWYELDENDGTYFPSPDTEDTGADYYKITAVEVTATQGSNPKEEGWYVLIDGVYVLSEDEAVQSGTVYYEKHTESTGGALVEGVDYTASFNSEGSLVITLISGSEYAGVNELTVEGYAIDPSAVTVDDVIGGVDAATGKETGMEVIRQVYPKLNLVPGILLAPYWSQIPEAGIALMAKAANINGVFKAMAYVDIPTDADGGARKYTDVKAVKEACGFTSEFCVPCWPNVRVGDVILPYSAVAAARTAYQDAENDDIPYRSPSNISLAVTGTCLADGTEVALDQDQATTVGKYGALTATNINGFKMWGNNTGAYPSSGDAKDVWISTRRMFNWQGNTFILSYFEMVDDPMDPRLIENLIDSENYRLGALTPDYIAGASIEYLEEDNPETEILAGRITFRQHYAPYTPAETIINIINYDTGMLRSALIGGE